MRLLDSTFGNVKRHATGASIPCIIQSNNHKNKITKTVKKTGPKYLAVLNVLKIVIISRVFKNFPMAFFLSISFLRQSYIVLFFCTRLLSKHEI